MDFENTTQNEIYEPVMPNYYHYTAINSLEPTIDEFLKENKMENKINQINICAYEIDNQYKFPFLKFLLCKNPTSDILNIPELPVDSCFTSEDIVKTSSIMVFGLIRKMLLYKFEEYITKIEYNGFYIENENIYLFFNLTKCDIQHTDLLNRSNHVWFGIIDEIVNEQHICNFKVNKTLSDFFINNSSFCFLYDGSEQKYILPTIGYVGKHYDLLHFTFVFGVTKSTHDNLMGSYYYFTNYYNAIRQGGWSSNGKPEHKSGKLLTVNESVKYNKGGIVRFALFTDKIKEIQNLLSDNIDNSETKRDRLIENPNLERLTMRISDYDGKWTSEYNTVHIGKIILDNGNILDNTPMTVIKDYEQQVPLSYHYIDKTYLGEHYEDKTDYLII